MIPERLEFLSKFNEFTNFLVNAIKEDKIEEKDFWVLLGAKCKQKTKEIHYKRR